MGSTVEVNCDICGSTEHEQLFQSFDRLHEVSLEKFWVVRCRKCKMIFTNPRPDENDIGRFYPSENYYAYFHDPKQSHYLTLQQKALYSCLQERQGYPPLKSQDIPQIEKKILSLLFSTRYRGFPQFKPGSKILDIGCGAGSFLSIVRPFGFKTFGVELDFNAVQRAREMGHNVAQGSLEERRFENNTFDIVRFSHVVEHLKSPNNTLNEVHRILKRDGSLIIVVPNIGSTISRFFKQYWFNLDLPRHLYHFTPQTLRLLLMQSGFSDIHVSRFTSEQSFLGSVAYYFREKKIIDHYEKFVHNRLLNISLLPIVTMLNWFGVGDLIEVRARKFNRC